MSPPPSPSGNGALAPARGLVLLLAGLAIFRLATAALVPLTEDEAYYRLWSQHLSLGYYDHPPMIAWWIRAGIAMAGDNALGVRLLPALANLAATVIVYDIGRMLGGGRTGLWAALLYNCTLTIGAAAALAVPDAPAGFFWVLALSALAKASRDERPGWWLLAGAAAGLATLSKYSALFLAPAVVLWLAVTPDGRRQLLRPWPWAAAVIAAAIFGVNVWWNETHHWETFAKQFGRAAPGRLAPQYLLELIAGQFVLLNPAVALLAGIGAVRAWKTRDGQPIAWLMLAALIPFTAYLLLHSLHDRVQAHWPAPLYSAAAVLAAWAAGQAAGWRAALARLAPIGLALSVVALAHAALPMTDIGPSDPAAQLRGWPAFAQAVQAARAKAGAAWVGTLSYGVLAQLQAADHAANTAMSPILQIDERDRYADWPATPAPDLARPGLIVDLERRVKLDRLAACFAEATPLPFLERDGARYAVILVSGPKIDLIGTGCDHLARPR